MLGHLWTIAPRVRSALRSVPVAPDEPWSVEVPDDRWGSVTVTGRLREAPGSRAVVVIVHGLGGCTESHYVAPAANACAAAGLSCLRLNLRGSDRSGEDLYHAGLTVDLAAAVTSPELARYERVFVLGFSLGGHVGLRYATERPDPRVGGVVGVCSPLQLIEGQRAIDRPQGWLYRAYLMARLRDLYRPIAARRGLGPEPEVLERIRTIYEWDRLVVAPRFGFASPEEYYERASVAGRLDRLATDALVVASRRDPMVPPAALPATAIERAPRLEVCWVERGGHVGFPRSLDLGIEAPPGLESQVLGWLAERAA